MNLRYYKHLIKKQSKAPSSRNISTGRSMPSMTSKSQRNPMMISNYGVEKDSD